MILCMCSYRIVVTCCVIITLGFTLASGKGCSDVSLTQDTSECHFLAEGGEQRTDQFISSAVTNQTGRGSLILSLSILNSLSALHNIAFKS